MGIIYVTCNSPGELFHACRHAYTLHLFRVCVTSWGGKRVVRLCNRNGACYPSTVMCLISIILILRKATLHHFCLLRTGLIFSTSWPTCVSKYPASCNQIFENTSSLPTIWNVVLPPLFFHSCLRLICCYSWNISSFSLPTNAGPHAAFGCLKAFNNTTTNAEPFFLIKHAFPYLEASTGITLLGLKMTTRQQVFLNMETEFCHLILLLSCHSHHHPSQIVPNI